MPNIAGEIGSVSNPFICFPGTYLFFGRQSREGFINLVESYDIGIFSYNISSGNAVIIISAKDLMGKLEYAGMIHITSSTFPHLSSFIKSLPDAYFVRAYIVGDPSLFRKIEKILAKRNIKLEGTFPYRGTYQHVVLWYSPVDGLHMNVSSDENLPSQLLDLIGRAKNIDHLSKALFSLNEKKLAPAFDVKLLEKEIL